MPKFENYPEDSITTSDKVLFFKSSANAVKSITFSNLVNAIVTSVSSLFTSATVLPSTAPAAGRIPVGNSGGTAYAPVPISGDASLAATGALTISANSVSYSKMQDVSAASRLLGRGSSGSGDPQEILLGSGLSMSGTTLSVSVGTGNVIQASDASEANHVFVSGGPDKSRVETPMEIDPSTGDIEGVGDLSVDSLTTTESRISAAHSTNNTLHGITLSGLNAGATLAQWDPVYIGPASTYLAADANGVSTYPARGLAVAAYVDTDPAIILREGTVRHDDWNWTPGGDIFLSTTAGLTQTAPSTSTEIVQKVGFALTADIAYFSFGSGDYDVVP